MLAMMRRVGYSRASAVGENEIAKPAELPEEPQQQEKGCVDLPAQVAAQQTEIANLAAALAEKDKELLALREENAALVTAHKEAEGRGPAGFHCGLLWTIFFDRTVSDEPITCCACLKELLAGSIVNQHD